MVTLRKLTPSNGVTLMGGPIGAAAPSGPVSSIGWRLSFPQSPPYTYHWFGEVELRTTLDGPQEAIHGTTGTGSASNQYTSSYPGSKAFDNNNDNYGWCSAGHAPPGTTLSFEFNSAKIIKEVYVMGKGSVYRPLNIDVQYYDGSEWVTIQSFPTPSGDWVDGPVSNSIKLTLDAQL